MIMNNQKGFAPILIIIVVVIVLAGGALFFLGNYKNTQNSVQTQQQVQQENEASSKIAIVDCSSHQQVLNLIKDTWKDLAGDIDTDPNQFGGSLEWKLNDQDPYITYPGIHWSTLQVKEPLNKANEDFKNQINEVFIKSGFQTDKLNTRNSKDAYRYGYIKNGVIYKVDLNGETDLTSIDIMCAQKDQKLDTIYSELIPQRAVRDVLSKKGEIQNIVFSVNVSDIHTHDVIKATEISHDSSIADHIWFYKMNGEWKFLTEVLYEPNCKLLEDLHIEPGVACQDPLLDEKCKQKNGKQDCDFRVTR